jgi:hypothetical protein
VQRIVQNKIEEEANASGGKKEGTSDVRPEDKPGANIVDKIQAKLQGQTELKSEEKTEKTEGKPVETKKPPKSEETNVLT